MYTSYYAKAKTIDTTKYKLVSIARITPIWYEGEVYKALAPTQEMVYAKKNDLISEETFEKAYRELVLDKLDMDYVYNKLGDNAILLCYEKSEDFCHRHLLSKYLREKGFNIEEYEEENTSSLIDDFI